MTDARAPTIQASVNQDRRRSQALGLPVTDPRPRCQDPPLISGPPFRPSQNDPRPPSPAHLHLGLGRGKICYSAK
jgi:hypothetical protein